MPFAKEGRDSAPASREGAELNVFHFADLAGFADTVGWIGFVAVSRAIANEGCSVFEFVGEGIGGESAAEASVDFAAGGDGCDAGGFVFCGDWGGGAIYREFSERDAGSDRGCED